jgi:hypothetical protein
MASNLNQISKDIVEMANFVPPTLRKEQYGSAPEERPLLNLQVAPNRARLQNRHRFSTLPGELLLLAKPGHFSTLF